MVCRLSYFIFILFYFMLFKSRFFTLKFFPQHSPSPLVRPRRGFSIPRGALLEKTSKNTLCKKGIFTAVAMLSRCCVPLQGPLRRGGKFLFWRASKAVLGVFFSGIFMVSWFHNLSVSQAGHLVSNIHVQQFRILKIGQTVQKLGLLLLLLLLVQNALKYPGEVT